MNEKYIIDTVRIECLFPQIILITVLKKGVMNEVVLREISNILSEMVDNKPYHVIIDISVNTCEITKEGRLFIDKFVLENKNYRSNAIILNSITKSMLVGAFLYISKISIPLKTFTNIQKAVEWIEKIKLEER